MKKPVSFYSEGVRLIGDVYYPDEYMEPAFGEVMREALAWYRQYLAAR